MNRSNDFEKFRKKMVREGFEENSVRGTFEKLANKIKSFRETIPLIQQLKGSQISERHWVKLLVKAKCTFELNVKTINLQQVLQLNLQEIPEDVNEICMESSNEAKNEYEISQIEAAWKKAAFEI